MNRSKWLDELRRVFRHSSGRRAARCKWSAAATRRATFEPLEERALLALLTVNSALDNATSGDGLVTLREAIIAANTNATTDLGHTGSGADTIEFTPSVNGTIALSFVGELIISESLTIDGPGRDVLTIDALGNSRILNIAPNTAAVTISGLTLFNGETSVNGGAIWSQASGTVTLNQSAVTGSAAAGRGGGIYSSSSLVLTDTVIDGNSAMGKGGGAYVKGSLSLTNSVVTGNTANAHGGGFYVRGSYDYSPSNVNITASTISGNVANVGGGFYARAHAGIQGSTINDNTGGGFALRPVPDMAGLTGYSASVMDSTISGNSGAGLGATHVSLTNSSVTGNFGTGVFSTRARLAFGGITGGVSLNNSVVSGNQGRGIRSANTVTITNSIVNDNMGGGVDATFGVTVNYSTVSNNTAAGPGGGILSTGGVQNIGGRNYIVEGPVTLNSTTVTGNSSGASGGGIYAGGILTLNNSTVSRNEATGLGGGVHVEPILNFYRFGGYFITGTATLNSSTVSGNESGEGGGGVSSRRMHVNASTVTGNTATLGGGINSNDEFSDHEGASHPFWQPSHMEIQGSIVSGNTASGGNPDLYAFEDLLTVQSSLIGDNSGTSLVESHTFDANGNLIGSASGGGIIDPLLAPLADNGGPTSTHALLVGSPAIDAIPPYYSSEPIPARDYQLNGSLSDTFGGPGVEALGGTLTETGYEFGLNQGLNLSSALDNPANYSVEILFCWDALSGGWQKIVDFHDLNSNVGLYTAGTGLHFLDTAFTPSVFSANTLHRLVITRDDSTDIVQVYVDGTEVLNFTDVDSLAVFDGPDDVIRLFQDDTTTGQLEAQSGFVDLIRVYNKVLTATEVAALPMHLPVAPPPFDQRGEPFARVVDGDGMEGPQIDMGAYEFQGTNSPPIFTSPDVANVPENTTAVMTVTATDPDVPAQTVTFSIVGGADQSKFAITGGNALSFISAPDFEAPTDTNGDNVYEVTVQADDGSGGTATQTISITVTPVNDNSPVITSPDTANVPENTTAVLTVAATDADVPTQSVEFSIVAGADQSKLAITSGGTLTLNDAPDYERPTDADGDNVYVVTVEASDGQGGTTTQTINVTVAPLNDNGPVFTSPDTVNVPEDTTAVLTVTATDADLPPQTVNFSIVGGADRSKFTITPAGALTFKEAPDFEQPTDANGDNLYVIIVQATDGSLTDLQAILVTVTNVNELTGDYNQNRTVDAADYVIWRKMLSMSVPNGTGADGDGDGVVDEDDHGVWRANFGRTQSGVGTSAVIDSMDSHPNPLPEGEGSESSPHPGPLPTGEGIGESSHINALLATAGLRPEEEGESVMLPL